MTAGYVEPKLSPEGVIFEAFRYFAHMDEANAAIHMSRVRYSPITFRCAEHLQGRLAEVRSLSNRNLLPMHPDLGLLERVLNDLGEYEEDKGR
jgi:hypothetical protein